MIPFLLEGISKVMAMSIDISDEILSATRMTEAEMRQENLL